ncbi:hypothetical protein J2728_001862 [Caulobacter segnis]|nr:hypothetical protein [Caulobacter segnis]
MTLRPDGDVIRIEGHCRVEDAERLTALLQGLEKRTVDVSACEGLHAAAVQTILAFGCEIVGDPTDRFLSNLLKPALERRAKL